MKPKSLVQNLTQRSSETEYDRNQVMQGSAALSHSSQLILCIR